MKRKQHTPECRAAAAAFDKTAAALNRIEDSKSFTKAQQAAYSKWWKADIKAALAYDRARKVCSGNHS